MPIPGPGGSASQGGTLQNESFYEGLIRKYYGDAAASQYAQLYSQYQAQFPPTATESTAYEIFNPFFTALVAGEGVAGAAKSVADAVSAVSTTTAQNLPKSPLSGLAGLFQANIWLRVGEVVLGLVLIAVGLARVTSAVPIATKVAKSVGTVALA